jgi:hypothetical protein
MALLLVTSTLLKSFYSVIYNQQHAVKSFQISGLDFQPELLSQKAQIL